MLRLIFRILMISTSFISCATMFSDSNEPVNVSNSKGIEGVLVRVSLGSDETFDRKLPFPDFLQRVTIVLLQ